MTVVEFLDSWVKESFSEDLSVVEADDFYYMPETDEIGFSKYVYQEHDDKFLKFAQELGLEYDVDVFLLSLLHEVGHYFTIEDEELDAYWKIRLDKGAPTNVDEYYRDPIEAAATKWAVDYINDNFNEIEKLTNMIFEQEEI